MAHPPSGRVTSHRPNLQNIPIRTEEGRRIRAAFVAPGLIHADYSELEPRYDDIGVAVGLYIFLHWIRGDKT